MGKEDALSEIPITNLQNKESTLQGFHLKYLFLSAYCYINRQTWACPHWGCHAHSIASCIKKNTGLTSHEN